VIDRETGMEVANFTSDAFFQFHHVHAYENAADNTLVIDLITYPNNSMIVDLFLDVIHHHPEQLRDGALAGQVSRFRLPMSSPYSHVTGQKLGPVMELPITNHQFTFKPYTYVYGVGFSDSEASSFFFDAISKLNIETGETVVWAKDGCFPGEPIFVADPKGTEEDDGVLLSVVLDSTTATSFLLVLKAQTLEEIATASVPHHIPFGFHGAYHSTL